MSEVLVEAIGPVAILSYGLFMGYWLGRRRPLEAAREWARWKAWVGEEPPGRVKCLVMLGLLPERTVPVLWHRVRHGRFPEPGTRPAAEPVRVVPPAGGDEPGGVGRK